jgi:hypothetical protein
MGQGNLFPIPSVCLAGFVGVEIYRVSLPHHGEMPDAIIFIILGYVICFLVFLLGGFVQFATRKGKEAAINFLCALTTFLIGFSSLKYLASS